MKRLTVFTVLYLSMGVCFSILAFQHPNITPNNKQALLLNAGLLCLCSIFSTFGFWRQYAIRRQNNLYRQVTAWVIIASGLYQTIFNIVTYNWTIEGIARASFGLTIILLGIENVYWLNKLR